MSELRSNPYATDKILHEPHLLRCIRDRVHPPAPSLVMFMPQLKCNQACGFCAYGHRRPHDPPEAFGWRSMELMSRAELPWDMAERTLGDLEEMGVGALEVTGGGEPLLWRHIDAFLERAARGEVVGTGAPIEMALVTNGTLLTPARAQMFGLCNWQWARVSIDAGSAEGYTRIRRVTERHWGLAWDAVGRLAALRTEPYHRVGVGYVVDRTNCEEVWECCRRAKEAGADNVRISAAFTPQGLDRWPPDLLEVARAQAAAAVSELAGPGFDVHNLLEERLGNLSRTQGYHVCGSKEVICVLGGDGNAYTCCTLAFNSRGLIGEYALKGFRKLWREDAREMFSRHDARKVCQHECLYERRNLRMLELANMPEAEWPEPDPGQIHRHYV